MSLQKFLPCPPRFVLFGVSLAFLLFSGCASERYARPSQGTTQRGMASWYGADFHGKPTASGEIYDMHQLSAAHKELPLHTVIDVKNLDNGRTLRVQVNDRGPYIRGRILDLSYGAARKLGMVEVGLARVEIRVVKVGAGRAGPSRLTRFTVQLGAFREIENAREMHAKVTSSFPEVEIQNQDEWHRVRIGLFTSRSEASDLVRELKRQGFDGAVVPLY